MVLFFKIKNEKSLLCLKYIFGYSKNYVILLNINIRKNSSKNYTTLLLAKINHCD